MKYLLGLFLIQGLLSCTNEHYKRISHTKDEYNSSTTDYKIVLNRSGINPSKMIMSKLGKTIGKDYIYIYSWNNHLPIFNTTDFRATVLDVNTKRRIYLSNGREHPTQINIYESSKGFEVENFLLDNYLEKKIDYLKSIAKPFSSSEMGSVYYLFDIRYNDSEVYVFDTIVLDKEGKPIR